MQESGSGGGGGAGGIVTTARNGRHLFYGLDKFSDLDILFFHTEAMPYAVIQSACFCEWCHVAIVIELTDGQVEEIRNRYYAIHPSEKPKPASKATSSSTTTPVVVTTVVVKKDRERKYVLEATTDNLRCAVTGKLSDGVKLTPLEKNIKRCDPTIGNYYGIKKALPRDDRNMPPSTRPR